MSHSKERNEKNCLNCNARVQGRFCHICGQENLEPAESVWHMTTHFFNDITHFDGKFFSTLKYLITKPGFLSREYMAGRRVSYLNPIRMYLFTSAFFFLIFFNFLTNDSDPVKITSNHYGVLTDSIKKMDSATFSHFSREFKNFIPHEQKDAVRYFDSMDSKVGLRFTDTAYASLEDYHRVLKEGKRHHNWLEQKLITKQITLNEKYQNDSQKIWLILKDKIRHNFPQIYFISLPFFALLLKLLYVRRSHFYYTNHFIFGVHLFIFYYLGILISYSLEEFSSRINLPYLAIMNFPIIFFLVIYCYKAMRNFYQQSRIKTLLKFLILFFTFSIVLALITISAFILSFFKL